MHTGLGALLERAGGLLSRLAHRVGRCACCSENAPDTPDSALCLRCRMALATPEGTPCPGCAAWPESSSTLPDPLPTLCGECRRKPRPWTLAVAHGPYDGQLRDLILAYKFDGRMQAERALQECLLAAYERAARTLPGFEPPHLLVPVPLHSRRLLRRGFNQSREIARLLSSRHGLPIDQHCLRRIRRTTPQMELGREQRADNIRGAFEAREARVGARNILLIDDIMTTGSTLEECARILLRAGANRVDVLVLARA